jgi:hypothetical protein
MNWLRRRYGAGPLHLLSLVACIALVGYVVTRMAGQGGLVRIAAWFFGALILHDFVLWPLYALADRSVLRLARRNPDRLPRVPWINHVRVPAIISGILFGISFPLILRLSNSTYQQTTGLTESPYLGHWLLVTGVLFAGSAIIYAFRLGRAGR